MSRPLLVGEAPSKSGDKYWAFPLSGAVGKTLCELAGIEPEAEGSRYGRYYWALRERFDCANLIERYPGPQGRGAAFPIEAGRAAVSRLLDEHENEVIVLLGRRLPACFGVPKIEFYHWDTYEDRLVVAIPHPSGLNRLYNSDQERISAGSTLQTALFEASHAPA